jgi:predicted ribosome quality control (RQC) complex YloA/Tae2 family protein
LDTAARSRELQTYGELILAYQHTIQPGDAQLLAYDYEGIERTIKLNSERSPVENANSFFDRAKRAKSRAEEAQTTHGQINQELLKLKKSLVELENSRSTSEISEIRDLAKQQRWLVIQDTPEQRKETRPFDGKRVRELLFNGYKIYYGENSEANDYVTTRLARPNDWWLHVRGGASAHVVVSTANQPTRVPFEVLREAAKIAVKNSPQKHSHLVAVDYTLKKHVRKPRGSATGFVTYTQEKTIDVNPGE